MFIQIVLSAPVGNNGPMTTNQVVPFDGLCNVKILQVDINSSNFNSQFNWFTIRSNTLLKPPYISKILISNSNNYQYVVDNRYQVSEHFGNSFIINDILINGKIDITINVNDNNNFTGTSPYCILWLDVEYSPRKDLY